VLIQYFTILDWNLLAVANLGFFHGFSTIFRCFVNFKHTTNSFVCEIHSSRNSFVCSSLEVSNIIFFVKIRSNFIKHTYVELSLFIHTYL
jgi:hypothetical protein